jgi:hypothetical protein
MISKMLSQKIGFDQDDERTVVARITTTAVDREGDVVLPQGAMLDEFTHNPVVFFAHEIGKMPVGQVDMPLDRQRDSIIARVKFAERPENHPDAAEWVPDTLFSLFKQRVLRGFSMGFSVPPDGMREPGKRDKQRFGEDVRRIIERWKLLELSIAPVPMNQEALAMAVSKGLVTPGSHVVRMQDGTKSDDNDLVCLDLVRPSPLCVPYRRPDPIRVTN